MTTSDRTWVYAFENGDGRNKMLLGGKGANLCEMTRIGLNVPPGFVPPRRASPTSTARSGTACRRA